MDTHECHLSTDCRIMRRREVLALVGVAKSTLYTWITLALFPAQVEMARRAVGWRSCQVYNWLATRPSTRPSATVKYAATK